jgi:hypothetical protein
VIHGRTSIALQRRNFTEIEESLEGSLIIGAGLIDSYIYLHDLKDK